MCRQAFSGWRVIRSKLLTFYCSPDLRNGSFAAGITLPRATLLELICYTPIPLSETPLVEGLTREAGERRVARPRELYSGSGFRMVARELAVKSKARLRSCSELQGAETLRQSAWASL